MYWGVTGAQGETGLEGTVGDTGAQGETGKGVDGANPIGYQPLSAFGVSFTGLDLSGTDEYNYGLTVNGTGDSGMFYVYGGETGAKYTIEFSYGFNKRPNNWTGLAWAAGTAPVLSGQTGVVDMIHLYYNGTTYYAQSTLGYA